MTEYQRNTASFCFYGTIQFLVFTDFDILSYIIWYRLGKVVYNADRIFVTIYKNLIYLQSFNFAAGITKFFFINGDSVNLMMGILIGIVNDLA